RPASAMAASNGQDAAQIPPGYRPASRGSRETCQIHGQTTGARPSSAQGSHCADGGECAGACCWSRRISQSARSNNSAVAKLARVSQGAQASKTLCCQASFIRCLAAAPLVNGAP